MQVKKYKFSWNINLELLSVLLLFFPYLAKQWEFIRRSPFYSIEKFTALILVLFIIDFSIRWLTNKFEKEFTYLSIFIAVAIFFSLYGMQTFHWLRQFNMPLHARHFLPISIIVSLTALIVASKYIKIFRLLNLFFFFLGLLTVFSSAGVKEKNRTEIQSIGPQHRSIRIDSLNEKPIILLIADEYASPEELFRIAKDSTVYRLSNALRKMNWQVRNGSYSFEVNTVHSMGSIFNFNLSHHADFSSQNSFDIIYNKLMHAALADSLRQKNVATTNFGILNFGSSAPLMRLWLYPNNFIESVFQGSRMVELLYRPEHISTKRFKNVFYYTEAYNKHVLKTLPDTLEKIKNSRAFIYVHLFMPHNPKSFEPEFKSVRSNTLDDYIAYWRFSNQKLLELVRKLTAENRFRIIFTGDHGLRKNRSLDPRRTFTAFYGFHEKTLEQIHSVQDIGLLINSQWK
jgi:hypothetical protein